jgi:flagellar biosynthesis/type III secretory pathway protein FliH
MRIEKGRLLAAAELPADVPALRLSAVPSAIPRGRLLPPAVVEAADRAKAIVFAAEQRARELLDRAERSAADVRLQAEAEGRAEGAARLAAQGLALAAREAAADERALERSIELARLLAERLLGESLRLAPEQVTALAREALREARGARRVTIVAHPEDARLLEASAPSLGLDPSLLRIAPDPARARGHLRVETDIGVLDAEIGPQLERLALKLREALAYGPEAR